MLTNLPPDYPDAYRDGKVEFFGREFVVTPDVLIPRLETECLVRKARAILDTTHFDMVVDIGTGSGIILSSVANKTRDTRLIGIDISAAALRVAERNFSRHHYKNPEYHQVGFRQAYLLDGFLANIKEERERLGKPVDVLFLANLPYVKENDWENMSSDTKYEPRIALFGGGKTGFEIYIQLFAQLAQDIRWGDYGEVICIIEFGFDQLEGAREALESYEWEYEFFADYAGIMRFAEIRILSRKL